MLRWENKVAGSTRVGKKLVLARGVVIGQLYSGKEDPGKKKTKKGRVKKGKEKKRTIGNPTNKERGESAVWALSNQEKDLPKKTNGNRASQGKSTSQNLAIGGGGRGEVLRGQIPWVVQPSPPHTCSKPNQAREKRRSEVIGRICVGRVTFPKVLRA